MYQPMHSFLSSTKELLTKCLEVYSTVRLYDDLSSLPSRTQEDILYKRVRHDTSRTPAHTLGPTHHDLQEKARENF